jgi:hypothetical protein
MILNQVDNVSRAGYTTEEMLLHLEEIFEQMPGRYQNVIILGGKSFTQSRSNFKELPNLE